MLLVSIDPLSFRVANEYSWCIGKPPKKPDLTINFNVWDFTNKVNDLTVLYPNNLCLLE